MSLIVFTIFVVGLIGVGYVFRMAIERIRDSNTERSK